MFSHLTYKAYKNECKAVCSERCISLFGWSGSLSVITAYGLTSFDSDELLVESKKNDSNIGVFVWLFLLLLVGGALFRRFKLSEV